MTLLHGVAQIAAIAARVLTSDMFSRIWPFRGEDTTGHRNMLSRGVGSIDQTERIDSLHNNNVQSSSLGDGKFEKRHKVSRDVTLSSDACLFCMRNETSLNTIIDSNETFYARLDNFPATPGHVEIVPKRHVESFFDLSESEVLDAYTLIRVVEREISMRYGPGGYTIGINEGRVAGRSVDHLHIHLIPRHEGDVPDPRGGIRQVVPNCNPDAWTNGAVMK